MNRISRSLIAALALASALAGAGTANAQSWSGAAGHWENPWGNAWNQGTWNQGGSNWNPALDQAEINRRVVASTCSGQRAFLLESRLRREVYRGQISCWTARRIQNAIDHLQVQERRECRQRDFYSAREVGQDYIRIRAWIDRESFGRRAGFGDGYGGGFWRR